MSLNYDDLIGATDIDFHTGFADTDRNYQRFRPEYPWPGDRHLWCQVHGSVLFRMKRLGPWDHQIVRFRSRHDAAKTKWFDAGSVQYQDRHVAPYGPIITGLRKADALQSEPYASYAHVLREEAFSCDRWLIVGYGGGDQHINRLMLAARAHWLRSGVEHRVVFIGHYPELDHGGISLGALLYDSNSNEWTGIRSVSWFFESEEFENAFIQRYRMASNRNRAALSLDGVEVALGSGLPLTMRHLGIGD
jgi:hypothetical protein